MRQSCKWLNFVAATNLAELLAVLQSSTASDASTANVAQVSTCSSCLPACLHTPGSFHAWCFSPKGYHHANHKVAANVLDPSIHVSASSCVHQMVMDGASTIERSTWNRKDLPRHENEHVTPSCRPCPYCKHYWECIVHSQAERQHLRRPSRVALWIVAWPVARLCANRLQITSHVCLIFHVADLKAFAACSWTL